MEGFAEAVGGHQDCYLSYHRCIHQKPFFSKAMIQNTFQSGQRTIMVWGAVVLDCKGPLVQLEPGDGSEKERKAGRQSKGCWLQCASDDHNSLY